MNRSSSRRHPVPRFLHPLRLLTAASLLVMLAAMHGCLIAEDHLTIQTDGSGTVVMRTTTLGTHDWFDAERHPHGGFDAQTAGAFAYPPLTNEDAAVLFGETDMDVNVTKEKDDADREIVVVTAKFADINQLMRSPYGYVHQLTVTRTDQSLTVRGRTGAQTLVLAAKALRDNDEVSLNAPKGADQWRKNADKLRCTFAVTLPGKATAQADAVQDATATWTVDREKLGDDAKAWDAANRIIEVSCPADGVTFQPDSPTRLALDDFAQVAEKQLGDAAPAVDAKLVQQQARWTPVRLNITRSFNLTGDSFGMNESELIMELSLPKQFRPMTWGTIKATQVTDDQGNQLLIEGDDMNRFHQPQTFGGMYADDQADEDAPVKNLYTLQLKPVPAKTKALAKVTGAATIEFPGVSHLIKIANALNVTAGGGEIPVQFNSDSTELDHPLLKQLNGQLRPNIVQQQRGMTMAFMTVTGPVRISKAQVFDKFGKPWPTLMADQPIGGESSHFQLMVLGEPQSPLSLVMIVSGGGAKVELPFEFKDLAVEPNNVATPANTDNAETGDELR